MSNPAKITRNKRETIRFTQIELDEIKSQANIAGLVLAEYIRKAALGQIIKPRLTPDEILFMRQLVGMANNLNQLARSANVKEEINLEAKALLFQLNWIIEKLK